MKFGKSIGFQQDHNADLHYVDYKLLKKRIKDVSSCQHAHELADALTANTGFEEGLIGEITLVNTCFAKRQQELLRRTGLLAEDFQSHGGSSGAASSSGPWVAPAAEEEAGTCGTGGALLAASRTRPEAFRMLVDILREVDQLRKYAVWNAVAVVKILKKRRKQTNFGLEDTAAERAGWLSRQSFFSGSDFAELHAAIESLGHMLVLSQLGRESALAALSPAKKDSQQCPICLDTISDMVELSCRHRFCWKCFVLGPIANQPGEYRITQCPICRRETTEAEQGAGQSSKGAADGLLMPSSEGLLTRFLHTYFPEEADDHAHSHTEGAGLDDDEEEVRDVVAELVKALLADATWQQNPPNLGQASSSPSKQAEASHSEGGAPSDFFHTLPQKSQQDKQMLGAAQKLQWLQLASTGDPLAVDGTTYCSLCSEPLLMEAVVTTPCKHYFHRVCIGRVDLPQCPLCSCALPFSWFLPERHPCADHGFRVVSPGQYKPCFPGGPSRGTCGFPLRRPPPLCLHGAAGLQMKSYLHRIPPTLDPSGEAEVDSPGSAHGPRGGVATPDGDSSASESSSEESGSDDGDHAAPAGSRGAGFGAVVARHRCRQERKWAFSATGRTRLVQAPAVVPEGAAARSAPKGGSGQSEAQASAQPSDHSAAGDSAAGEQRNPKVLLIGDHV